MKVRQTQLQMADRTKTGENARLSNQTALAHPKIEVI